MPHETLNLPKGHRLDWREVVSSTNRVALELAEGGEKPGLWLVADKQTSGRGRSNRSWISQPGNLFASFLTCLSSPPHKVAGMPLVAGIALYDAVQMLRGEASGAFPLALKWPNDLTCFGAKLAGILVETASSTDPHSYPVVIGFGLNLVSAPHDIDQGATSLKEHGLDVDCPHALEILATSLDHQLGVWQEGRNMEAVREAWLARGSALGTPLQVKGRKGEPIEGRFAGLDEQGALLLDRGGKMITVSFGDVDLTDRHPDGNGRHGKT